MTAIFLNGEYVSVTDRGRGKPVLFLHGYLSCKESFYYQIAQVERLGRRAVAPDMPAFGASFKITGPWSVGDYAAWLKDFIFQTGIQGADFVVHSFGARVAFKLLSQCPEIAGKLLITGGAGLVKPRSPQYLKSVKRYRRIKKLFPKFAEKHFGSTEYKSLSPVMRESYKLIVNEDLRECAGKVTNKTLLVYGRDDTVTPPAEEGRIFAGLISGSRLEVMNGTHFCFSEYPDEFNRFMTEFLLD